MEITSKASYDPATSDERIREILDSSEAFEEVSEIPSRDKLTYANGYYVNCTAVFIDIRDSSSFPEKHTRPVLGKIYRAYLSECVALMNRNENCKEVFIHGDCVSGIFNTPKKKDIDGSFATACQLNTLVKILNWRFEQRSYTPIRCGIGVAYGRALMMKAGYKGSGVNEVIWLGDVVNQASNLCHQGNKNGRENIQVSTDVHLNLKEENKSLLNPVYDNPFSLSPVVVQHEGDLINIAMNDWLNEQVTKSQSLAALLGALGKQG